MHTYIHTVTYSYIQLHTVTYSYIQLHTCIHTRTYTYICIHVRTCACKYIHIRTYIHIHICIYIYTHSHVNDTSPLSLNPFERKRARINPAFGISTPLSAAWQALSYCSVRTGLACIEADRRSTDPVLYNVVSLTTLCRLDRDCRLHLELPFAGLLQACFQFDMMIR